MQSLLIPPDLLHLLQKTPELSRAYLVGGCIRDALLGCPVKDYDIEVFGVNYEVLTRALSRWGKTDLVGKSFGVVKLALPSRAIYDFSLPRRDSKVAPGHKGFTIEFDPQIQPEEAAARRDFTINSLMFDPKNGQLLDFYQGQKDLERKVLRHTSPAFAEDPLRVLRGMQFCARFGLSPADETIVLCQSMAHSYKELPKERVEGEWFKWAEKSEIPSLGLKFLAATGWMKHFPEIACLIGTPQEPEWHPEGDVFVHTGFCCDAMAELPEWKAADKETKIVLMFAILCHDLGKPATTHVAEKEGRSRIVSPGHEEAGVAPAESFLTSINAPLNVIKRVVPLVKYHLAHLQIQTARSIRRLATRLAPETITNLCTVVLADHFGRPPKPKIIPEGVVNLRQLAEELRLENEAPKPILLGRHLLERGLAPGPAFKGILDAAFEAQLDGAFGSLESAQKWLTDYLHPYSD